MLRLPVHFHVTPWNGSNNVFLDSHTDEDVIWWRFTTALSLCLYERLKVVTISLFLVLASVFAKVLSMKAFTVVFLRKSRSVRWCLWWFVFPCWHQCYVVLVKVIVVSWSPCEQKYQVLWYVCWSFVFWLHESLWNNVLCLNRFPGVKWKSAIETKMKYWLWRSCSMSLSTVWCRFLLSRFDAA